MNKKFLSAILFGALMVTSTGTFVSCKDYDDDIDSINKELTDIKSQLAALQSKVDAGNYVTNITKAEGGINVAFSNGTTSFVETGAVVDDEACYASAATVVDGKWVINKADGTTVATGIPASGVLAVKNEKGQWVLSVYNANGEKETITLPSAASLMSEVEVKGFLWPSASKRYVVSQPGAETNGVYTLDPIAYEVETGSIYYDFSIVGGRSQALSDEQKAWNAESMTKKLAVGQALSTIDSYNSSILVRIAPASVDASELEFSFVNSKMQAIPVELGTPVAFDGLLTSMAPSRAAGQNGLWMIPVSAKEGVVYEDEADYMSQFEVWDEEYNRIGGHVLFGLMEKEGFVSDFNLKFRREEMDLTSDVDDVVATLNKKASVDFSDPRYVYDAHLHFAEADVLRWGINYSGNGVEFTITKLNDELSIPTFNATVHYVTLDGEVHAKQIVVTVSKNVVATVYDSNNIKLNSDNTKNNFSVTLDKMFSSLGNDASVLWKNDVDAVEVAYYRVAVDNEVQDQAVDGTNLAVAFYNADGAEVAGENLGKAVKAKVTVNHEAGLDRTKQYYALVTFKRTVESQTSVINTIKLPFTISIPTLAELLKKETVVFGGTSNGTAVLNEYDYAKNNNVVMYSLTYAFNGLADTFNAASFQFVVDDTQKTTKTDGSEVLMESLVELRDGNAANARILLNDKINAYNKPINILVADGAKYLNNDAYKYTKEERAEVAFTLKIVSPIEQGTLTAKDGAEAVIEIVATDGIAKLKESDLLAKTYAGVAYNVFMTKGTAAGEATKFASPYLKDKVVFESTNTNVFTVVETKQATIKADGTITAEGYTALKPMNAAYTDAVPVKITLTDVWGYKKEAQVSVKVKPSADGE